jgi:acyl-CoA reductase-like NAD-dependent aldehyde dehydrogenase
LDDQRPYQHHQTPAAPAILTAATRDFDRRYTLEPPPLGMGTFGTVYRAMDHLTARHVTSYLLVSVSSSDNDEAFIRAARQAWDDGVWTNQYTLGERIASIRRFLDALKTMELRDELATILQLEITKNVDDAYGEVDRTIAFVEAALQHAETSPDIAGEWSTTTVGTGNQYRVFIKRAALGVVLVLAPFNYPDLSSTIDGPG